MADTSSFYSGIINPGGGLFTGTGNTGSAGFLPSGTATGNGGNTTITDSSGNFLSGITNWLGSMNWGQKESGPVDPTVPTNQLHPGIGSPLTTSTSNDPTNAVGSTVKGIEDFISQGAPRVVVVVLGFIFVALGLAMFGRPVVQQAVRSVTG